MAAWELLPEAAAERAVVDGAADLQHSLGAALGPAQLLGFGHPAVHQEIGRALGQRRADAQTRPVPLGRVDQPVALAGDVAVERPQDSAQLARGRDAALGVWLDLEGGHGRLEALEAGSGVLGLAVPRAPAQPLDLLDDYG